MVAETARRAGRPRGLNLNTVAVEDRLGELCISKGEIARAGGITTGHLADALYRAKGLSEEAVRQIAGRLKCSPGTIAPELTRRFVVVREGEAP